MKSSDKNGFTLIELLVYIGIFVIVSLFLVNILISTTQIQVRQNAVNVVNQESQFVLQEVQNLVENSSYIDIATGTPTSTLKLRMSSSSLDPALVFASSSAIWLSENGVAVPLTSNRVTVSGLSFQKYSNPPAHDTVSISFTMAYNTNNPQQKFNQTINSAISRVNAATFDSSLYPLQNNLSVGSSNQFWSSINGIIYFSNGNVGIGAVNPTQQLEINGGLRLNPSSSLSPGTCSADKDGTLWLVRGTSGVSADVLEACLMNASGTYAWVPL